MKSTFAFTIVLALFLIAPVSADPPEDPFDPGLVIWDPGTIQNQNDQGQWSIQLDNRSITQADIASLSPLEIQQAVKLLTDRTYPIEFVLDHLEQFRALITVDPRG